MSEVRQVWTSLEVGFPSEDIPERFAALRGKMRRSIGVTDSFPYEDSQFEIVLMSGNAVSRKTVKEAHRVLKPNGRLYFTVSEKSGNQSGFTLPEIYSIIRDGYDIVDVKRPPWWLFGFGGRTITISARKKTWKTLTNTYRPYL